jgi:hypothetical protein
VTVDVSILHVGMAFAAVVGVLAVVFSWALCRMAALSDVPLSRPVGQPAETSSAHERGPNPPLPSEEPHACQVSPAGSSGLVPGGKTLGRDPAA